MNQQITSPEAFFGFQLGSDRKIARWDQIVDYFRLLEEQSDKIQVMIWDHLQRGTRSYSQLSPHRRIWRIWRTSAR